MIFRFNKYHGTGNDFIIADNRDSSFKPNQEIIKRLCDRYLAIGADGLILLQKHEDLDFEMKYYNSDGYEGSMCGNGGRCITAYANKIGLIGDSTKFYASDGNHEAKIISENLIKLKMNDVFSVETGSDYYYLDTGSPHIVQFVEDVLSIDVQREGKKIRLSDKFKKHGTNVNFVQVAGDQIFARTYKRGVENETLSCGTGAVATAICSALKGITAKNAYLISFPGGELKIYFNNINNKNFKDIWLEGKVNFVFEGSIKL